MDFRVGTNWFLLWCFCHGSALLACSGADDPDRQPDADADGVPDAEDCAPQDLAVYPGATEVCDGVDQDCDGAVDEESVDATPWYTDADADGHGDPASRTVACAVPDTIAVGGDCDDGNPAVYPGAAEVCGDGVDNDCVEGAPRCPFEGEIRFDQATRFLPLWGCEFSGLDFNADGIPDAGCADSTVVYGPFFKDPPVQSWRPERLLADPVRDASVPGDIDQDGAADILTVRDNGEIGVYFGPWSRVREDRGDRLWSMPAGSRIWWDGGDKFGVVVEETGSNLLSWIREIPEDGASLVDVARWTVSAGPFGWHAVPDQNGDGESEMLLRKLGAPHGHHLMSGAAGHYTLPDAEWVVSSTPGEREISLYRAGAQIVALVDVREARRTEVREVDPRTGALSEPLLGPNLRLTLPTARSPVRSGTPRLTATASWTFG